MSTVPNLLKQRWASRELIGDAQHACLVRIRQGHMFHQYQHATMLDTTPGEAHPRFGTIWKGNNVRPWQGQWIVTGDWITLPNVQSANWTRDLTSNGGSVLTVVIDDVAFLEQAGPGGAFHTINRGYYSPTRGVKVTGRANPWKPNEWADVLNAGYQIELWEGYGQDDDIVPVLDEDTQHWSAPAAARTWVGWIDDVDLDSHPDHVTITCRDASVLLTDQRMIGFNKAQEINAPITFADRRKTLGETRRFGHVTVSSGQVSSDERTGASWRSGTHTGPGHPEWIEMRLEGGYYREVYADMAFDGETMYISVRANGGDCAMNGAPIPDGWVDIGAGSTPGAGGVPYVAEHPRTQSFPSRRWSLGKKTFKLGDGSIIRITFDDLVVDPDAGRYRAGVDALYALRYGTDPEQHIGTKATGWVLVDDAADVVRTILLWAGFHEMDVQSFGWSLEGPTHFGMDSFFIDVINAILAEGNYVFYIAPPTDHDMSLGVPIFRAQTATSPAPAGMLTIRDTQLAEALQIKWDKSNLPYVIRVRGDVTDNGKIVTRGVFFGQVKRYVGTYWPPWSGHDWTNLQGRHFKGGFPLERLGGVRRHSHATVPAFKSVGECLFACILLAIQFALQAVTGTFQIPGRPGINVNQQVSIVDEGTGTTSRLWVASVDSQHALGPSGAWHMTIGGALLDTEDLNLISQDYKYTFRRYVAARGPSK